MRIIKRGTGSVLVALLLGASPCLGQSLSDPSLNVEAVVTGLSQPTTLAFISDTEFLVLQKSNGQVRYVRNDTLQAGNALDLNVNTFSERGLLGIATNPNDLHEIYLYFTEADGMDGGAVLANRVVRYDWNPLSEQLENATPVLDLPGLPGPNHNGGILVTERIDETTAYLYTVIGDMNHGGQLQNAVNGPPPDDTGVILRTLLDGTPAPGNPFDAYCEVTTGTLCSTALDCPPNEACITEVERYFAYGVRNSFGMALDPTTGFLWDTENGPSSYDEVNRVEAGMNSGWVQIMGPDARDPDGIGNLFHMPGAGVTYSDPEFSWLNTVAPTAILFPVGSSLGAAYENVAIVGDNNTGQLYEFPLNGGRTAFDFSAFFDLQDLVADDSGERDLLSMGTGFGVVTDLKLGPDNHVYVSSWSHGTVYRISGSGPVSVLDREALGFVLQQNHPNPFQGETRISYEIARSGVPVTLEIFDVAGRAVRRLVRGSAERGAQHAAWDGTDARGQRVAPGLYYYRLTVEGAQRTRKMLLVR